MNYRLIHNNNETIAIIEASGVTCSNGNEIFEGNINEIAGEIDRLNLTNFLVLSSFGYSPEI